MKKSEYTELMAKIAEGGKVSAETHADMVAFAKKAKVKRPPADAVIDEAAIEEAKTSVKNSAKAPKAKAPKAKCSVTKEQDEKVGAKGCQADSRAGGMCATHYSRLIYRAKPENAEKAREASRNYAQRVRDEKAKNKAKTAA